jgi:hypothetical protein
METGDTVKITKPSHPACSYNGIVMRVEWLDYEGERHQVAEVAGINPLEYTDDEGVTIIKEFPLYVIRLNYPNTMAHITG